MVLEIRLNAENPHRNGKCTIKHEPYKNNIVHHRGSDLLRALDIRDTLRRTYRFSRGCR